jgi:hypothetical protein
MPLTPQKCGDILIVRKGVVIVLCHMTYFVIPHPKPLLPKERGFYYYPLLWERAG